MDFDLVFTLGKIHYLRHSVAVFSDQLKHFMVLRPSKYILKIFPLRRAHAALVGFNSFNPIAAMVAVGLNFTGDLKNCMVVRGLYI